MIKRKNKQGYNYFALHLKGRIELNNLEQELILELLKEQLIMPTQQEVDFENLGISIIVDILRCKPNLS